MAVKNVASLELFTKAVTGGQSNLKAKANTLQKTNSTDSYLQSGTNQGFAPNKNFQRQESKVAVSNPNCQSMQQIPQNIPHKPSKPYYPPNLNQHVANQMQNQGLAHPRQNSAPIYPQGFNQPVRPNQQTPILIQTKPNPPFQSEKPPSSANLPPKRSSGELNRQPYISNPAVHQYQQNLQFNPTIPSKRNHEASGDVSIPGFTD